MGKVIDNGEVILAPARKAKKKPAPAPGKDSPKGKKGGGSDPAPAKKGGKAGKGKGKPPAAPEKPDQGMKGHPGQGEHSMVYDRDAGLAPKLHKWVETTETPGGRLKYRILGQPLTAVMRLLATKGWTAREVESLCLKMGIATSWNTVYSQVSQCQAAYRAGSGTAELSGGQVKDLRKLISKQ